jgi:hypothetical protein
METTMYVFVCEKESGKERTTQIDPLKGTQHEGRELLLP